MTKAHDSLAPPTIRHLVMVGLTGSGKSTVARLCAARLGWEYCDTDSEIERSTGRTIREIFDDDGESVFRDVEQAVLAEVLSAPGSSVIATGGGIVLRKANREMLVDPEVRTVWLLAGPDQVRERLRTGSHRPLLDGDAEATLQQMWIEREPLYREVADAIVSVDQRSLHEVVEAVLR